MIGARVVLGALLGLGLGACFQAPGGPVLFSCEPGGKSACPPGYECRSDDCCHDVDTPPGADLGACKLTPSDATGATDAGTASESGTAESGTAESGTATEPGTGSDTGVLTGTDAGSGSGTPTGDSGTASSGDATGSSDDSAGTTSSGTAG